MKAGLLRSYRAVAAAGLLLLLILSAISISGQAAPPPPNPQSGSVGLQGRLAAPPPSNPAIISLPVNGQAFASLPIKVNGLCQDGLLVKLYKNGVFSGAADCRGGSFNLTVDLFEGQNQLLARVFDNLDQAGPDSQVVTVSFSSGRPVSTNRVTLISNFARRGAEPGQKLDWPLLLTGGSPPYAISVDWGDGTPSDLLSQARSGPFTISHRYDNPGIYNVLIKVSDSNGETAFLQLVGIANGAAQGTARLTEGGSGSAKPRTVIIWWPLALVVPLLMAAYWLGHKSEIRIIKRRLESGRQPF